MYKKMRKNGIAIMVIITMLTACMFAQATSSVSWYVNGEEANGDVYLGSSSAGGSTTYSGSPVDISVSVDYFYYSSDNPGLRANSNSASNVGLSVSTSCSESGTDNGAEIESVQVNGSHSVDGSTRSTREVA